MTLFYSEEEESRLFMKQRLTCAVLLGKQTSKQLRCPSILKQVHTVYVSAISHFTPYQFLRINLQVISNRKKQYKGLFIAEITSL